MRFIIAVIVVCASAFGASAQTHVAQTPMSPGFPPPPPPAPSTIAPRPPNEFAPPPVGAPPTVPPRQVDDAMRAVCPTGKNCAPGTPAR